MEESNRICPYCDINMELVILELDERTEVDRCPSCGLVFVDFFDGDLEAIAQALDPAPASQQLANAELLNCPDCDEPAAPIAFVMGAAIRRCFACSGMLLSPRAIHALDHLDETGPQTHSGETTTKNVKKATSKNSTKKNSD